jgi:exonuclease III
MGRIFNLCFWNVRGLRDHKKCSDVLAELLSSSPHLVLLQETKLPDLNNPKLFSFMPKNLNTYRTLPADGASGGLITAWNDSHFSCSDSFTSTNSLTVLLSERSSDLCLRITNVYAPSIPELRPAFLDELKAITPDDNIPWLICRDFNMIRYACEKNNDNFRHNEADAFNDMIHDICLIELPLMDRQFTWSNRRASPTLERIDRAFINTDWDSLLPNTILSSLTHSTSDHVPLKIQISTSVPKSPLYRFENSWIQQPAFLSIVSTAWNLHYSPPDPASSLVIRLKRSRATTKKVVQEA